MGRRCNVQEKNTMFSPDAEQRGTSPCMCDDTTACRRDVEISRKCRLKRQLDIIQEIAGIACWVLDLKTGRVSWSKQIFTLLKHAAPSSSTNFHDFLSSYLPEDSLFFREALDRAVRSLEKQELEMQVSLFNGKTARHRCTMIPDSDGYGKITAVLGYLQDITTTDFSSPDHADIPNATGLIGRQSLNGLLPICSHCKKVRDDHGSWEPIESYITERSNLFFSHGICPECLTIHYSEYFPLKVSTKLDPDEL